MAVCRIEVRKLFSSSQALHSADGLPWSALTFRLMLAFSKCCLSCVGTVSVWILGMNLHFLLVFTDSLAPKWLLPCFWSQLKSRYFWGSFASFQSGGAKGASIVARDDDFIELL